MGCKIVIKDMLGKAEDIAKNMIALGTMSMEDIAKCTGLSVAEVE